MKRTELSCALDNDPDNSETDDHFDANATAADDDDDGSFSSYTSISIPKLQFRKEASIARWDSDIGMAEVVQKKGSLWTSIGVTRCGKLYCFLEEALYLSEKGALVLQSGNGDNLELINIYRLVTQVDHGCCWKMFEAYRHLKSLGYVVGRHGVPWSVKKKDSPRVQAAIPPEDVITTVSKEEEICKEDSVEKLLADMSIQEDELKVDFDVYLPNGQFAKSAPGDPDFMVCLIRGGNPPAVTELRRLESLCKGIPLQICHADHGRVSFFNYTRVELSTLP